MLTSHQYARIAHILSQRFRLDSHRPTSGDIYIWPHRKIIDEWVICRIDAGTAVIPDEAQWVPLGDDLMRVMKSAGCGGIVTTLDPQSGEWMARLGEVMAVSPDRDQAIFGVLDQWDEAQKSRKGAEVR